MELLGVVVGAVLGWIGQALVHRQTSKDEERKDLRAASIARQARVEDCMRALLSTLSDMRQLASIAIHQNLAAQPYDAWHALVERATQQLAMVADERTRQSLTDWVDVIWLSEGIGRRTERDWPGVVWDATVALEAIAGCVIREESVTTQMPTSLRAALEAERKLASDSFGRPKPPTES